MFANRNKAAVANSACKGVRTLVLCAFLTGCFLQERYALKRKHMLLARIREQMMQSWIDAGATPSWDVIGGHLSPAYHTSMCLSSACGEFLWPGEDAQSFTDELYGLMKEFFAELTQPHTSSTDNAPGTSSGPSERAPRLAAHPCVILGLQKKWQTSKQRATGSEQALRWSPLKQTRRKTHGAS